MRALLFRLFVFGCGPLCAGAGDVAVLYDPDLVPEITQTPKDQGFERLSSDLFAQGGFYTAGAGVTDFDSGPGDELIATFFTHGLFTGNQLHPAAQTLDRNAGFKLSIDLAIDSMSYDESYDLNRDGVSDVAGFSLAVVSSDLNGIGIEFWPDRIWVAEDDSESEDELLAQAEGVEQSPAVMSTLRRYEVEVKGDGYRLRVDGEVLLVGRLRDYSNFEGYEAGALGTVNNFDKPNSITLGDPVRFAHAAVSIGDITSETPFDPAPRTDASTEIRMVPSGGVSLRWDAIPGTLYSLRASDDLGGFLEFADHLAAGFVAEFVDDRPLGARRFYQIEPYPTE